MLASPNSNQATIRQDDHPEPLGDQQQLGIRVTEVFGKPAALHDAAAIAKSLDPNVLRRGEPKSSWTYLDPKIITCHTSMFKKTILMRIAYYIILYYIIYIYMCVFYMCYKYIYIYIILCVYVYYVYTHTQNGPKPWKPSARPRTHHLPPGSSEYTPLPVVPCLPHRWPAPGHGVQLRPGASLGRWPPRSAAWVGSSGIAPWCPDFSWPLLEEACRILDGSNFENSTL